MGTAQPLPGGGFICRQPQEKLCLFVHNPEAFRKSKYQQSFKASFETVLFSADTHTFYARKIKGLSMTVVWLLGKHYGF